MLLTMQIGHVKEAEQAFARSIRLRGDRDSAVSMRMVRSVSHVLQSTVPACHSGA